MTDKFLSGWGMAENKTNKLVLECNSYEEAEIVKEYAQTRTEMVNINICTNKPNYNQSRYYVSEHNKTDYPNWYKQRYNTRPEIQDMKLDTVKNARLFTDLSNHFSYLVHYDHVILTIKHNPPCENKIVDAYAASNTSQKAIHDALTFFGIDKPMIEIYKDLGKTKEDLKNNRQDFRESLTGQAIPRFRNDEWRDKIRALEKYDYTKGNYLYNGVSN